MYIEFASRLVTSIVKFFIIFVRTFLLVVTEPFVYLFDAFIRRTILMATLEEIGAAIDEVTASVGEIDTDLDAVRDLIAALKSGAVTQEQIDALASKVEALKAKTASVVAEAEGLKA